MWRMSKLDAVAFIVRSNAGRQARLRAKRDAEIEALHAAIIKAELARAQAENHLLRQRVLDLEKALVRRESAVKSAQTKAASEVARLKEKNKELELKLRHMWDWHNNEVTKAGGLTFKASSLIAKALHPELHAKRGGQAGSLQGVLGVEGRQGRGAAALVERRPIYGTPQAPVTRAECICSVLNSSGLATTSSTSRAPPSSLRARVSYSCAIILNLFAASG